MLRLYYAVPTGDSGAASSKSFSAYRKNRLFSQRRPEDRTLSMAAELLLIHAVKSLKPDCSLPLRLQTNAFGKPMLENDGLHFSLSHTTGFVVCAIGDRELGVDVEKTRTYREALVRRFFCPEEQAFLGRSADSDEDFTVLWTLKESYLKALGCGLNRPLNSFCVCLEPRPHLKDDSETGFWYARLKEAHVSLCVPGDPCPSPELVEELVLPRDANQREL